MSIQFRYGFLEMPKQRPTSIERQASQQKRSKETHVRRAPSGQVGSGKVLQPAVHTADKLTRHYTHTHTRLTALCLGLPGWAGTRKVEPIWILLKQETVSGSGISWAVCKSAPRSQTDNHVSTPPLSFLQARCPSCRLTNSIKALKALKAGH